jgi:hypothetical protein
MRRSSVSGHGSPERTITTLNGIFERHGNAKPARETSRRAGTLFDAKGLKLLITCAVNPAESRLLEMIDCKRKRGRSMALDPEDGVIE